MRLVNFGTGEVTDRLTILGLKILFGKAAGRPVDHFEKEQAVLLVKMQALNGRSFEQVLELAAVNAALWHKEDELRDYRLHWDDGVKQDVRPIDPDLIVRCAFRIQALNDRRAQLVTLINANTGEHLGDEKVI